jgi:hypothetical protein
VDLTYDMRVEPPKSEQDTPQAARAMGIRLPTRAQSAGVGRERSLVDLDCENTLGRRDERTDWTGQMSGAAESCEPG